MRRWFSMCDDGDVAPGQVALRFDDEGGFDEGQPRGDGLLGRGAGADEARNAGGQRPGRGCARCRRAGGVQGAADFVYNEFAREVRQGGGKSAQGLADGGNFAEIPGIGHEFGGTRLCEGGATD